MPAGSTEALVRQAADGNAEAFGSLYDLYVAQVYRHVRYRVAEPSDAEDLTEQTFLKAWQAIPRYQQRGIPFHIWLLRIAANLLVDYYRAQRPRVSLDDCSELELGRSGDADDPVHLAESRAERERVHAALQQLTTEQRNVILLRFYEGLGHEEVAALLNRSQEAVRGLQFRALAALRRVLAEEARS